MTLMKFEDVSFSYGKNLVLDKLHFEIKEKDYIYIVGENGSGKTTLLKLILGLTSPDKGYIEVGNFQRNEIGYIPQQKNIDRDFPASVYEIVLSGRLNNKGRRFTYSQKDKKIADLNIEKLGIGNLKNKPYRSLSGGQQQKVLLCRALCATKKILVLDEPDTGLDIETKKELYNILKRLNIEDEIAIIMVTHDIRANMKNGNKIFKLENNNLKIEKIGREDND